MLLLIGLVLYVTGTFEANPTFLTLYQVLLVISAVYAIITTIKRLLGVEKKVKRSKGAQIVERQAQPQPQTQQEIVPVVQNQVEQKPIYYRVKQNPEYVMAEYPDRYELFRITDGQMKKIRTDYK
jgi:hypothetical protein